MLIHAIGENERFRRRIVQRNAKVASGHQIGNDAVNRAIQFVEILSGVNRFGDAIQRGLNLLGALSFSQIALHFGQQPRLFHGEWRPARQTA